MPRPTAIQVDRKRRVLIIPWDDGHVGEYPWAGLREACPCVECRGGHENMGRPPEPDVLQTIPLMPAKNYDLVRVVPVGNYAIQPEWGDGHHTGIYTWSYLRQLRP